MKRILYSTLLIVALMLPAAQGGQNANRPRTGNGNHRPETSSSLTDLTLSPASPHSDLRLVRIARDRSAGCVESLYSIKVRRARYGL